MAQLKIALQIFPSSGTSVVTPIFWCRGTLKSVLPWVLGSFNVATSTFWCDNIVLNRHGFLNFDYYARCCNLNSLELRPNRLVSQHQGNDVATSDKGHLKVQFDEVQLLDWWWRY